MKTRNLLWLLSLLAVACSRDPQSIDFGRDECAHCKMVISDRHFGSELMTSKGKFYKFDAIECLAGYVKANSALEIGSLWVVSYNNPDHWLEARDAYYMVNEKIPSPMGKNLSAFKNSQDSEAIRKETGSGSIVRWNDVLVMSNR